MNDFRLIEKSGEPFTPAHARDIHQHSLAALEQMYHYATFDFLKRRPDGKTEVIVLTHHAPTHRSLIGSPRHGGMCDFAYFSNLRKWIIDRAQISTWLHGHAHWPCDYRVGNCRIISNPRGYGVAYAKDACFDGFDVKPLLAVGTKKRPRSPEAVNAGLARARQSGTKSGKAIGRPKGKNCDREEIRAALLDGRSVRQVAKVTGASVGTTAAVRKKLVEAGLL